MKGQCTLGDKCIYLHPEGASIAKEQPKAKAKVKAKAKQGTAAVAQQADWSAQDYAYHQGNW